MSNSINENYISIEDAALFLNIKPVTLRKWIKDKNVPAHKIGKQWKFKHSELEEWVKAERALWSNFADFVGTLREGIYIMSVNIKCVDLFCGCGGMSLGFQKAGFNIVAGIDNWKSAIRVYGMNFNHPIIEQDLLDVDEAVKIIAAYAPDLIIGGPPCQDFSTAGYQDESRGRAILSVCYSQIVSKVKPKYFVMENVATIRNTTSFRNAIANFHTAGYGLTQMVLDAAYCGVPQTRKRMFVVGMLDAPDSFLDEELRRNLSQTPMSIHDYLGDSLGIGYYFRVPTNYSRRGVFSIYEPSMTIRGVDRPIPKGYKGHPNDPVPVEQVRCLTPKERSYIQTFPESFQFVGGKSDVNSMIGNAVPVNLAKYVGSALMRYIMSNESRDNNEGN